MTVGTAALAVTVTVTGIGVGTGTSTGTATGIVSVRGNEGGKKTVNESTIVAAMGVTTLPDPEAQGVSLAEINTTA